MDPSLQTIQKQVEKETAQGHSWDTVVQLRMIQELIEVSSQVAQLSKVLGEILTESRKPLASSSEILTEAQEKDERNARSKAISDGLATPSPAKRGRGRPSGKGHA